MRQGATRTDGLSVDRRCSDVAVKAARKARFSGVQQTAAIIDVYLAELERQGVRRVDLAEIRLLLGVQ